MSSLEMADYEIPDDEDIFNTDDGCWLWRGTWSKDGYGLMQTDAGLVFAHIYYYEARYGTRPAGMLLDHLCRKRACCNPEHLEPVTVRENTLRGVGPSAINARKTHCLHGHPFDEQNTVVQKDGRRKCRACAEAKRSVSKRAASPINQSESDPAPTTAKRESVQTDLDAKIRQAWKSMRQNCSNPNRPNYRYFGGMGVRVCDEWQTSIVPFRKWAIENGCAPGLVLSRKDKQGDFSAENCSWITTADPQYVKTKPHDVTAWGETKRVAEWARDARCSVTEQTILYRLDKGWGEETAISTPPSGKQLASVPNAT